MEFFLVLITIMKGWRGCPNSSICPGTPESPATPQNAVCDICKRLGIVIAKNTRIRIKNIAKQEETRHVSQYKRVGQEKFSKSLFEEFSIVWTQDLDGLKLG